MMTEREAIQALEIMLRPGEGQCSSPTIAHRVLMSFMDELDIPVGGKRDDGRD